ncbi:MAG: ABC transporter permease [Clostridia bacterium]|nr:ABC transporter permease [Clostridia bacterium]
MFFQSLLNQLPGGIAEALIWAILALGVFVTYKILDFADLTVDSSFATGGCVAVILMVAGAHPILAMAAAFGSGAIAGIITAILNTKLKIPAILSGILTMSALYSVNIHILGMRASQALVLTNPYKKIPSLIERVGIFFESKNIIIDEITIAIAICIITLIILIAFLYWFFGTEQGSAIRATGNNKIMATAQGINTDRAKIIALALSNGFAALSGAMLSQYNSNASINDGSGAIVIALASVVIGELIFGNRISFWVKLLSVVIGSLIYRLIIVIALQIGFKSEDLKLISSIILVIALCVPEIKKKLTKLSTREGKKNA